MNILIIALASFMILASVTSCEHKDLCYTHPHISTIRVTFNWDEIPEAERPEGMRVKFYPTDQRSDCWIFDFSGGVGRTIEIPQTAYHVVCYNYDTEGIIWANEHSYSLLTAETKDALSPDGEAVSLTPSFMCGDYIRTVDLTNIPEDEERVVTLTPKKMVCRYTYEVHGISNPNEISHISGSLSGMSGALLMDGDRLPENLSESLFFDGQLSQGVIRGEFFTFGYCQRNSEQNIFKLYLKNRSNKLFTLTHDVTKQVHGVAVNGHLGDVHLKIHLDYTLPSEPGGDGGGNDSGGSNAGFDVGADDWGDINTEIQI